MNDPPRGWDKEAWAASAREYAANRLTVAPPTPEDYAGPVPVGLCPTCGHDPCQTPGFCAACRAVDRRNARERQTPTARSLKIRRMVADPTVSLDRLWNELNYGKRRMATTMTIEALMLSLRNRGPAALTEIDTSWRIGQLSYQQYREVVERLLRPKSHWKPWSEADVEKFMRVYAEAINGR